VLQIFLFNFFKLSHLFLNFFFPSALIISAEFDILRDEAGGYAERLSTVDIETELLCAQGMTHGFYSYPLNNAPEKDRMMVAIIAFIKNMVQVDFLT